EDPDSDLERSMNYHISYNFPQTPAQPPLDQNDYRPRYSNEKWQRTKTWNMKERRPFHPCIHAGSCADANCRCFREQIFCERSCSCSASCERRYSGCTCKSKNLPCSPNKGCTCRAVNRECDPELCRGCGAAEALDPNNRYREGGACRNVSILRGVTKKTLLGTSTVHGWGLFTGEDFQQDDYIGEYTGERITETEMSRREVVYQHEDTMYGWGLTDSNIDGTHAGNRLRFINHSRDKKVINCYPRVELCNTIIRIGLYATGPMKAGIELFFDYGYSDEVLKNFKPPK
ncbi:SET domain-containing protein, partial [Lophiostoma macrostomum CBS 122681]